MIVDYDRICVVAVHFRVVDVPMTVLLLLRSWMTNVVQCEGGRGGINKVTIFNLPKSAPHPLLHHLHLSHQQHPVHVLLLSPFLLSFQLKGVWMILRRRLLARVSTKGGVAIGR